MTRRRAGGALRDRRAVDGGVRPYADDPEAVAAYVAGLGVAGVNVEDGTAERLVPAPAHAAKVAAIKARAPGVFVNARVDTF